MTNKKLDMTFVSIRPSPYFIVSSPFLILQKKAMAIPYFAIKVFASANEKLQDILSQPSSEFDSVIFVFNHSLRYKFLKSELGIQSVSDLLFPNGYGICRQGHEQSCHLYYDCVRFDVGLHRLQGTVYSYTGHYPWSGDLHLFVERTCKRIKLLYFKDKQWIVESRQLEIQKYALTRQERKEKYTPLTWKRLNEILSSRV